MKTLRVRATKARVDFRRRRDKLVTILERRLPGLARHGLPAGLHAVLDLPVGVSEADAVGRAVARGLAVDALGGYAIGPGLRPSALVIGYATPPAHAYTGALARLCASLA